MTLPEFKQWFEPHLKQALSEKTAAYRYLTNDNSVLAYSDHIDDLVSQGGKRVRPYLAWLMYRSCGGTDNSSIISTLCALELFHTFCLIHDDIIDHGNERHGVKTTHVFVKDYLEKEKRHGDLSHISLAQAMLVGDLLFGTATDLMHQAPSSVHKEFSTMVSQVILGQMLDVDTTTRPSIDRRTLDQKMALKTAGYTFISPLKIGALLADAPDQKSWCESVGMAIGQAFQIQDDILDITGLARNQEHKPAGNDLREGQHTFLTLYIAEHGSDAEQEQLAAYFRHDFSESDIPAILTLFESSGAIAAAKEEVRKLIEMARTAITTATFPEPYQALWGDLLELLESRT